MIDALPLTTRQYEPVRSIATSQSETPNDVSTIADAPGERLGALCACSGEIQLNVFPLVVQETMASRAGLELSHYIASVVQSPGNRQLCPRKIQSSERSTAIDQKRVHPVLLVRVSPNDLAVHVYGAGNRRFRLRPVDRLEDRRQARSGLRCRPNGPTGECSQPSSEKANQG
jgi:hypothetical protein